LHEGTTASPANGASIRYDGANNIFKIGVGSSVDTTRLTIDRNTGDISFYEDTGTTAKLFWDASAESLGIGTSSPATMLELAAADNDGTNAPRLRITNSSTTLADGARVGTLEFHNSDTTGSGPTTASIEAITNSTDERKVELTFNPGFNGATTEAMRIDSSGNVGIGTDSPSSYNSNSNNLVVAGSGNTGVTIAAGTSDDTNIFFSDGTSGDAQYRGIIRYSHSSDALQFHTAGANERMTIDSSGQLLLGRSANVASGAEATRIQFYNTNSTYDIASIRSEVGAGQVNRGELAFAVNNGAGQQESMRLDYSGNLLVGKTSADDFSSAGAQIEAGGQFTNSVASAPSLRLNRGGNDGDIIELNKAGTPVGSIFNSGTTMGVGSLDTGVLLANNIDAILPWNASTNAERGSAIDLGRATTGQFKNLYLSGSTIVNGSATFPLSLTSSAGESIIALDNTSTNGRNYYIISGGSSGSLAGGMFGIYDADATSVRMAIDSSGNFLVGTTSSTAGITATSGNSFVYRPAAELTVARQGSGTTSPVAIFNQTGDDGQILDFRKDGSTVGSIGTNSGLFIGSTYGNDAGIRFASDIIAPSTTTGANRDAAIDLGYDSSRFKDLYLSGGAYLGGVASANKLDDYEEGTWTPSLQDASGNTTTWAGSAAGYYTKVGDKVTAWFTFSSSSTAITSRAYTKVAGLPFTNNLSEQTSVTSLSRVFDFTWSDEDFYMGITSTEILFKELGAGNANVTLTPVNTQQRLSGGVVYKVA
jgi:hypothetical protein